MKSTTMVKTAALASLLALVLVLSGCTAAIPELGTQGPGGQAGGAQTEDSSGSDVNQTPEAHDLIDASETPEARETPEATGTLEPGEDIELKGTIDSLSGNTVVIDGQTYVVPPELQSLLAKLGPGAVVEIKAKLDANGQLVLVEIKVEDRGDDNANINDNNNDNSDDDSNLNTNTNENTNDNVDDHGGGDDSGGGSGGGDDSGGGSGGGDDSGGGGDDSGGGGS